MPNDSGNKTDPRHSSDNVFDMNADQFREAGHQLVDQIADFLGNITSVPASHNLSPEDARSLLPSDDLPDEGTDPATLLRETAPLVFDNMRVNGHPKSWGYIIGSPSPMGMLGDFLASAANPNLAAWDSAPVATEIEIQTVRWIAQLIGYPSDSSSENGGLFVSGGNMANMVGFLAARRHAVGVEIRKTGNPDDRRLVAYATRETHTWVEKIAELCGIGINAIHWIATDTDKRMDTADLRRQIITDTAEGLFPFIIVGTAGSVSFGAVDPLPEIAIIARDHNIWFHVDGAYGGFAAAADTVPEDIYGLREADSVAVDAHKWMFTPLEAGVVLVRNTQALLDAFSFDPPYYHHRDNADIVHFFRYGLQNSRCFRALKAWLILRHAGRRAYIEMVQNNINLAGVLKSALDSHPDIETVTHNLSIVTFRYAPQDGTPDDQSQRESYLNDLNSAVLTRVQRGGDAHISNAIMDGKFLLRACITNFRTTEEDVRSLPEIVAREGQREITGIKKTSNLT